MGWDERGRVAGGSGRGGGQKEVNGDDREGVIMAWSRRES